MKTFKTGIVALMLAGVLAACGSPALKSNVADAGHGTEGVATKPAEGGHNESPATKAADAGHETAPATRTAEGGHNESVATKAASAGHETAPATKPATLTAVKGQATYLERIALPADAVVTVQIQDVSKADAPAILLAEQSFKVEGKTPPFTFEVAYDASKINAKATYVVSVKIEQGGKLRYINTTLVPVITNGAPLDAGVITLSKVG